MKALVHVTVKPDVLDPQGRAIQRGCASLGYQGVRDVRQGKLFEIELDAPDLGRSRAPAARTRRQAARESGCRGLPGGVDRGLTEATEVRDGGSPLPVDALLLKAQCGRTIARTEFQGLGTRIEGKVRDSYVRGDRRTLIATDRISAFDVVLGTIPFKGQLLNQLAAFWFEKTARVGTESRP